MKAVTTTLSTAAILTAAVSASGCSIDACVMVCIAVLSGVAGMLANDYCRNSPATPGPSRSPGANRRSAAERRSVPAQAHIPVIIFNTTCA